MKCFSQALSQGQAESGVRMMQYILVMPATDAISERLFSTLGVSRAQVVVEFSPRGTFWGSMTVYKTDLNKQEITW